MLLTTIFKASKASPHGLSLRQPISWPFGGDPPFGFSAVPPNSASLDFGVWEAEVGM